MAGRFGKYGDHKRRQALRFARRLKSKPGQAVRPRRIGRRRSMPAVKSDLLPSSDKTHKTAIVAIPPEHLWPAIQGLRKEYDRHYRRWMPHITLLYPFRPVSAFEQVVLLLSQACSKMAPFDIRLARFDQFIHHRRRATLYLIPEPAAGLKALHTALWQVVPDCTDVRRFPGGFRPHLSVGQAPGKHAGQALCSSWQATWQPLAFTLTEVCLIWRRDPPDDIFRIGAVLPLGG